MKTRTLVVLVAVLVLLAAATGLVLRTREGRQKEKKLGAPLLPGLEINRVALITIQGPSGKLVELERGEKFWQVVQRYGYRAEFDKIRALVRKISELKVGRAFKATPEVIARLRLASPLDGKAKHQEQGVLIVLKDDKGTELAGIIIGKQHNSDQPQVGRSSQYVRLNESNTIYLVDKAFPFIETRPEGWLVKDLLRVKPADIKRICAVGEHGKVFYVLERKEKGQNLEAMGALRGKKLEKSRLSRLERAVSLLTLVDVMDPKIDPKAFGINKDSYVTYELFNGIRYKIFPGRTKRDGHEQYYVRVEVDYAGQPYNRKADTGQGHAKKKETTADSPAPAQLKEEAKELDRRLSPWVFEISRWAGESIVLDSQELVEKKGGEKTQSKSEKPRRKT